MRGFHSGLLAAGLVAMVGISVQGQATGRAGQSATGKITVDGCIQGAPLTATGAKYLLAVIRTTGRAAGAGRAAAGADDAAEEGTADATTAAAAPAATAPAAGTAAAPATEGAAGGRRGAGGGRAGGPAAPIRYLLDGDERIIAPHLNHVVEVAGTLSGNPAPSAAAGAQGPPAPPSQTLKVDTVKMVAALCQ